jgi:hypothetical protein
MTSCVTTYSAGPLLEVPPRCTVIGGTSKEKQNGSMFECSPSDV